MRLNKISWKNVGPFGNKLQSIELPDEGGLWMITGKNGMGKSFFINLPKILYYGKLDKFKKNEIANRTNGHGYIEGTVYTSPDTEVNIKRNLNPSSLRVHKYSPGEEANEENDIGKSGISNYQSYIDTEVTQLPYNIFSNIVSLSVNDFKSFMTMTPHDKRIIIDKLFAMEVINNMNEMVKQDLRDKKMNMDIFDHEINGIKRNINAAVNELNKLEENSKKTNTERIKSITDTLNDLKPKIKEAYDKRTVYTDKLNSVNSSYNKFISHKTKIKQDISYLNKQLNLYNKDKCPTCETSFNSSKFGLLKEDLSSQLSIKTDVLNNILGQENKYSEAFDKLNSAINALNNFIIKYESAFKSLNSELKKINEENNKEFKSIQNIISENSKNLVDKEKGREEFRESHKYLNILEQLYSESGVKKKILETYLPVLNKEIEYTLTELHFPYSLKFDSDFEPILKDLGTDISVSTLSTGEKKRADLTVLISIIRMLKRKYPQLNIFMWDEVLSSMDDEGIYDIVQLLQKISKELRIHIFIMNHTILPIEHFDYKLHMNKSSGFTEMTFENLKMEI